MERKSAYTVEEFCADNSISQGQFYKLKKEGRGPVEMDVGQVGAKRRKPLITAEAAAAWRSKMESATATAEAATDTAKIPA